MSGPPAVGDGHVRMTRSDEHSVERHTIAIAGTEWLRDKHRSIAARAAATFPAEHS